MSFRAPLLPLAHLEALQLLLSQPQVQEFLECDRCCMLADSYLLAVALTYFKRANFPPERYTFFNLLVALYLAHEVEEDDLDIKQDLVRVAMGGQMTISTHSLQFFLARRVRLWTDLDYKVIVDRADAEAMMRTVFPGTYIWRRHRGATHAGAAIRYAVKEIVYLNPIFRTNFNSFRCLLCEGFRYIAQKKYAQQRREEASRMQYVAGSCRSTGMGKSSLPLAMDVCNQISLTFPREE